MGRVLPGRASPEDASRRSVAPRKVVHLARVRPPKLGSGAGVVGTGTVCYDSLHLAGSLPTALQHTIKAVIRAGEQSGFVAECLEIPVVTEGATLDEVAANLREAVALHLQGEDLAAMGLAPQPSIVVTLELETCPTTT